jgi:NAD(P)-dependent dehydrogenase (short-subunit alcohol dehydrogenase family)
MTTRLNTLVTGASSGIGRATALELARRGHPVLAAARRADKLEELARNNELITPLAFDVTDETAVAAAVSRAVELTGGHGVDVLIGAAGYALLGPVQGLPSQAIERQFATNVFGALSVARALVPRMRERGSGRIINISSVLGRFTLPGFGVYAASKYALEAVSDALRIELAPDGIDVVLIEPAWVSTDIVNGSAEQTLPFAADIEDGNGQFAATGAYAARQMNGNAIAPETVARAIASAAEARSPKSRYLVPAAKARLLVGLMGALPDRIADRAKRRTVGFAS